MSVGNTYRWFGPPNETKATHCSVWNLLTLDHFVFGSPSPIVGGRGGSLMREGRSLSSFPNRRFRLLFFFFFFRLASFLLSTPRSHEGDLVKSVYSQEERG